MIRKGTQALQPLPASPDAFVWLRLYQAQMQGLVPAGPDEPLWWTLRRPFRPLSYHAARAMFTRASATLGSRWRLHDLRHTAAYRMARDPEMPLTDVQWVLGHAHLSTTQLYLPDPGGGRHRRGGRPPCPSAQTAAARAGRWSGRGRVPARVAERAVRAGAKMSGSAGPAAVTGLAGPAVYQGSRPLPAHPGPSAALLRRFPPRPTPASWALTSQPKPQVLGRLLAPPFPAGRRNLDQERRRA